MISRSADAVLVEDLDALAQHFQLGVVVGHDLLVGVGDLLKLGPGPGHALAGLVVVGLRRPQQAVFGHELA